MKYYKRLKIYKASNVTFNPETKEAYSYRWWQFVGLVNGYVVFNYGRYSSSTSKHQSKVRSLLSELGIKVDLYTNTHAQLQNSKEYAIKAIKEAYLANNLNTVDLIQKVFLTNFTQKELRAIQVEVEEELCTEFFCGVAKRLAKKERDAERQVEEARRLALRVASPAFQPTQGELQ